MKVLAGQSYRVVVSYRPRDAARLKSLGDGLTQSGMTDALLYETGGSYVMHRQTDGEIVLGDTGADITVLAVQPLDGATEAATGESFAEALADIHDSVEATGNRLMLVSVVAAAVGLLLYAKQSGKLRRLAA